MFWSSSDLTGNQTAEALMAKLLDWLLGKLKERLSPPRAMVDTSGGASNQGGRLWAASLLF